MQYFTFKYRNRIGVQHICYPISGKIGQGYSAALVYSYWLRYFRYSLKTAWNFLKYREIFQTNISWILQRYVLFCSYFWSRVFCVVFQGLWYLVVNCRPTVNFYCWISCLICEQYKYILIFLFTSVLTVGLYTAQTQHWNYYPTFDPATVSGREFPEALVTSVVAVLFGSVTTTTQSTTNGARTSRNEFLRIRRTGWILLEYIWLNTTIRHAVLRVQPNIVTCSTNRDKFIRGDVVSGRFKTGYHLPLS